MQAKTTLVFWTSVAAAVFLLGGTIDSAKAVVQHPSVPSDIVLALSVIGLVLAVTVAGRIIVVVGHAQRSARLATTGRGARDEAH
jgi:hypothetical protein